MYPQCWCRHNPSIWRAGRYRRMGVPLPTPSSSLCPALSSHFDVICQRVHRAFKLLPPFIGLSSQIFILSLHPGSGLMPGLFSFSSSLLRISFSVGADYPPFSGPFFELLDTALCPITTLITELNFVSIRLGVRKAVFI